MAKQVAPHARTAPQKKDRIRNCNRRQFLFKSSLLAAAAAALPQVSWASRAVPGPVSLSALSLTTFAGLLGTSFKVRTTQGGIVELMLRKAQSLSFLKLPPHTSGSQWEGFSLVFSGPPGQELPQDTYCFQHERVGRFSMFIVPIGQPSDGAPRYQAVFNRRQSS